MNGEKRSGSRGQRQLAALMEKVRRMKQGGDLEGLLIDEIGELQKIIYEEAMEEREQQAASSEADFPPSGVRAVRRRADDAQGGPSSAKDSGSGG